MKYLMFGLFLLNVYFAFLGYALNGFIAGYMFCDYINFAALKANT